MTNCIRNIQIINKLISNSTDRIESIDNRSHNILTRVTIVLIV